MAHLRDLHQWDVSGAEARRIQDELRQRIELRDLIDLDGVRVVAGVDNGYSRSGNEWTAYAAVIVLSFPQLEIVEERYAAVPVTFPYIPGLLSFREAPAILAAYRKVSLEPDVVLFDGQGYAHPRRIGIASHLGLFLERPAIGVAKSKLVGRYEDPAHEFGAWTELVDRGEVIGAVLRTKPDHSPLFVSPGHHITLRTAVDVVLACTRPDTFLPEPTGLAHARVAAYKQRRLLIKSALEP
jgi:deoxyribonuclease V